MASRSSGVLKSLEEEIQCPLCLEIFVEPKKLACDHVVCLHCLEALVKKSREGGRLCCPVCRDTTQLEGSDISQFPVAHQVNRLIDIFQRTLQEESSSEQTQIPTCCSVHSTQPLALYCKTCQKAICRDCAIIFCSTNKHQYGYLKDMAKKQKNELLEPARQYCQDVSTSLLAISKATSELKEQERQVLEQIESSFASMSLQLSEEKESVTKFVKNQCKIQIAQSISKEVELKMEYKSLTDAIKFAESADFEQRLVRGSMSEIKHDLQVLSLQRKALPNSPIGKMNKMVRIVPALCNPSQCIFLTGQGYKCQLNEYEKLKSLVPKQLFQISYTLIGMSVRKIKAFFRCLSDGSSLSVKVAEVEEAIRLSFTPQNRGQHELHILCAGTHVCDSPIVSLVRYSPLQIASLLKQSELHVPNATRIKCNGSAVLVVSFGQELSILKHVNQKLCVTKKIQIPEIYDAVLHDDHIYYTDLSYHILVKTDCLGGVVTFTEGYGDEEGKFNGPKGIQINKNQIFVCDTNNHRIQVFDTDLVFQRTIGKEGFNPGEFDTPNSLVFDDEGNMYVVEKGNHRVQVLSPEDEHVRYICGQGDDALHHPISASIFDGHIYVTSKEKGNISVYTLLGEYVVSYCENDGKFFESIDIDQDGFIYVTCDGKYVQQY